MAPLGGLMFLRRVIHLLLVMLVAPAECLALDAFPVPVR